MPESRGEVVGREPELATIAAFLDEVPGGPAGLLIEGEPGIGKTTLWREGVSAASVRGFTVLVSRPTSTETAWSFCGLGDLLRDVLDVVLEGLPEPQRRALEGALLLGEPSPDPNPLAVSLATLGALRTLSSSGPVVICIDDVQSLDHASASALDFACRRLTGEPVGMITTTRSPSTRPQVPGPEALPEDRLHHVTLGPLSASELDRVLRLRLGPFSLRPLLFELHRTSGGNPFHALEMARLVVTRKVTVEPGQHLPVPPTLRDLIEDRLAALPAGARQVLLVVAVSADPTIELVQRVMGAGPGTDAALESATREDILEIEGGRIRFTHPVLGSVLEASASQVLLRKLHGALAEATADPEEQARHLARSVEEPNAAAAEKLETAARTTRRRGAPDAGAELAEAAWRLTPPGADVDSARRRILAAEYHLDAGNTARSRTLLERTISSLDAGPTRAAALQRLGWVVYHEESWGAAALLFEDALREAGEDAALRTSIELDAALPALLAGDLPQASSRARAAMDRAKQLKDGPMQSRAAAVVGSVDFLMGKGVSDELMQRALEDETWVRPGPTLEHPSVAFGVLLKMADDLGGARRRLEAARDQTVQAGNEHSLPFILFHLAELECWSGNLSLAERHASEAAEIALHTGQEANRAFTQYALALVAAYRGREKEAMEAAQEGVAVAERSGALAAGALLAWVQGFVQISVGNMHRAVDYLGPLAEGAAAISVHEPGVLRWVGDAMEALVAVGSLSRAEGLLDAVERRAVELDRRWARAVALRCRGLIEAAREDGKSASGSLEAALESAETLGQPFELGRTLLVTGTLRRRLKQRRSAREALERALAIFEEMGTPLWSDKVRAELSRIGGRAPSTLDLTPTERKVAEVVAEGATNEEVARALFMSPKTVEWNLSRIYRKLGVRSRTELARWLNAEHAARPPRSSPSTNS